MKKNPLIIASSILGLTIATSSYAVTAPTTALTADSKPAQFQKGDHKGGQHGMKGQKGMKGGMMGRKGMQELNLTDAQKAQIEQLRTQNKAKMQQFKTQLDQMDANIKAQKTAGASTTTLLNLYKQKQAVMDNFFVMHQQERQQFINILTPEQQLKMYEHQGRGHGDRDGHRGGKDGKRPPMPMPAGTAQK